MSVVYLLVKSLPVVVKVYQIPKDFSEENIMGLIGKEISPHIEVHLKTSPDQEAYNYAWVNCPDRETARKVVGKLDQQQVEMQGSPSVHNPKKHTILARLQKGVFGMYLHGLIPWFLCVHVHIVCTYMLLVLYA